MKINLIPVKYCIIAFISMLSRVTLADSLVRTLPMQPSLLLQVFFGRILGVSQPELIISLSCPSNQQRENVAH